MTPVRRLAFEAGTAPDSTLARRGRQEYIGVKAGRSSVWVGLNVRA